MSTSIFFHSQSFKRRYRGTPTCQPHSVDSTIKSRHISSQAIFNDEIILKEIVLIVQNYSPFLPASYPNTLLRSWREVRHQQFPKFKGNCQKRWRRTSRVKVRREFEGRQQSKLHQDMQVEVLNTLNIRGWGWNIRYCFDGGASMGDDQNQPDRATLYLNHNMPTTQRFNDLKTFSDNREGRILIFIQCRAF